MFENRKQIEEESKQENNKWKIRILGTIKKKINYNIDRILKITIEYINKEKR